MPCYFGIIYNFVNSLWVLTCKRIFSICLYICTMHSDWWLYRWWAFTHGMWIAFLWYIFYIALLFNCPTKMETLNKKILTILITAFRNNCVVAKRNRIASYSKMNSCVPAYEVQGNCKHYRTVHCKNVPLASKTMLSPKMRRWRSLLVSFFKYIYLTESNTCACPKICTYRKSALRIYIMCYRKQTHN